MELILEKGGQMSEVNFCATYRIPVTQQGVNKAKKVKLKSLIGAYGGLVGTGNTGYARVSIPNDKDVSFIRKLKAIGYKVFQVFEGENISKKNLDDYIKQNLDNRDYKQLGKQKAKAVNRKTKLKYSDYEQEATVQTIEETKIKSVVPPVAKNETVHINKVDPIEQEQIRNTESYKDILTRYGKDFAEAVFFFEKK